MMTALLSAGLTDAFRNLGTALRLFWPALTALLVLYVAAFSLGYFTAAADESPTASFTVVGLFIGLYVFFMLCQGAVGWHRGLLLNEIPAWTSPFPRKRAFQYAVAVFVYILILLIGHLLASAVIQPYLHSTLMSFTRSFDWGAATAQQLDMLRWLAWAVRASPFATTVLVTAMILWLGRSWLLAYPHIAIRTVEPIFGQIKDGLGQPSGLVGALLVVYFLPSLLGFIYESATPMSIQSLPTILGLSLIAEIAISAFTFLWGLSILSRAYVKVIDGKVRLGMSDGTQA